MDAGVVGGLIGFGIITCIIISSSLFEKYCKKKKQTEHSHLLQRILPKKQSSMRDFFEQNTKSNELNVIRISS
jgi:hypothetical protein